MAEEKKPQFAFEKKLSLSDCLYGDIDAIVQGFRLLMVCMKETNQLHATECEFFRFDFRPPYFDESIKQVFPYGSLVLDLKWGSQK